MVSQSLAFRSAMGFAIWHMVHFYPFFLRNACPSVLGNAYYFVDLYSLVLVFSILYF